MKSILMALCILAGVSSSALAAPLEAYGKLPSMANVMLSPDGKRLAYVSEGEGKSPIIVEDAVTRDRVASIATGEFKIRSLQWADNDNLIIISGRITKIVGAGVKNKETEYPEGRLYNLTDNSLKLLINPTEVTGLPLPLSMPFMRTIEGETHVYVMGMGLYTTGGRPVLFRTNVAKGTTTIARRLSMTDFSTVVDADGKIVAQTDATKKGILFTIIRPKGEPAQVPPPKGIRNLKLRGFGRTPNTILVAYDKEGRDNVDERDDETVLAEISMDTLKWEELLAQGDDGVLVQDPQTQAALGYQTLKGDVRNNTFFDPADQRAWEAVKRAFPGQDVLLQSWSLNRRRIVVVVDSPTDGPAYALVDLDAKTAKWIGEVYAGLIDEDISPVQPVAYAAADGLALTGYLTLPRDRPASGLPLVVLPHGGPRARDEPGFDWFSQALASRGYAVLRVNFRGSKGFGDTFLAAGNGEFGRKMQTDLSDGVRHLVAKGAVDPARVCIVGASYGGYAALAGATLDRGVYRCAASISGLSDLRKMAGNNGKKGALPALTVYTGAKDVNDPRLRAVSPAIQVKYADIPILLVHGKDDIVVPYEQSAIMAQALQKAGKPYEFVTLEGEDHWMSRGETRLQMLQSVVTFLEKHNPPNLAVATAP